MGFNLQDFGNKNTLCWRSFLLLFFISHLFLSAQHKKILTSKRDNSFFKNLTYFNQLFYNNKDGFPIMFLLFSTAEDSLILILWNACKTWSVLHFYNTATTWFILIKIEVRVEFPWKFVKRQSIWHVIFKMFNEIYVLGKLKLKKKEFFLAKPFLCVPKY